MNPTLLFNTVVYVFDSEIKSTVERAASLLGAVVLDQLVPFLTTHIVCEKETPHLRQIVSQLHSRTQEGATSAKAALTTEAVQMKIVTPEWLKMCLINQKLESEKNFRP